MVKFKKYVLFLLRVSLGWMLLYAGVTKIMDPEWSAEGYIRDAQTFTDWYAILLQPEYIEIVNLANQWGLALLGASLIVGLFVRFTTPLAALLMILYYFPVLDFPKVGNGYIVDDHIIYALAFLVLMVTKAGKYWGLDKRFYRD